MESISKTPVDAPTAQAVLTDALGPEAVLTGITELTDGWFNAAYALTLEDGRRLVLKAAPPPDVEVLTYEHDIVRAEVEALRLIAAATTAPVPEVVSFDERERHLPSPCILMTFLPGRSLTAIAADLDVDERASVDAELGRHLRSINAIRGTTFGLLAPTADRHPTWTAAFGQLLESVLRDGERAGVELPIAYDLVREALADAAAALAEVAEPSLVYWDLWDGNVLVDERSHRLSAMLDLERAMWGDPLIEGQFGPHGHAPALLDAYGPIDTSSAGAQHRRALYTLHLHLVMSIEGTYRRYPEDPVGEWARTQLADDLARCRG